MFFLVVVAVIVVAVDMSLSVLIGIQQHVDDVGSGPAAGNCGCGGGSL